MAALSTASGSLAGRCAYAASRVSVNRARIRRSSCYAQQRGVATAVALSNPRGVGAGGRGTFTRGCGAAAGGARGAACVPKASSEDGIYRVMSANQEVSVVAVVGTKLVSDAVTRHKTAPTATAALGRSMLSAVLLGAFKGDDETVQITFKGDGPLGQITVISDNTGQVKGMVANPNADPPLRPDGKGRDFFGQSSCTRQKNWLRCLSSHSPGWFRRTLL